jgi:hypothetical protein
MTTEINTCKSFGGGEALIDTMLGYAEGLYDEKIDELF